MKMSGRYLLKSTVLPHGERADLLIVDGRINSISANIVDTEATVFDVSSSVVLPGLVDLHTHLRQPGRTGRL